MKNKKKMMHMKKPQANMETKQFLIYFALLKRIQLNPMYLQIRYHLDICGVINLVGI